MSKRISTGTAALLLIVALSSSPVPAGIDGHGKSELLPLLSPDGVLLGSFTDGALGAPSPTPNRIEEDKLALARQAIALAEAAGTRMVLPAEAPGNRWTAEQAQELDRIKLEHLAGTAPRPMDHRPGTHAGVDGAPATPESEVKP